jgi:hypothetical protein
MMNDTESPAEDQAEQPEGMTLRQWYAGLAMQGLLSDCKNCDSRKMTDESLPEAVARMATQHADELIRKLGDVEN